MTKQEYLSAIRGKIRKMPADDIDKFMDYYSEMIDDVWKMVCRRKMRLPIWMPRTMSLIRFWQICH